MHLPIEKTWLFSKIFLLWFSRPLHTNSTPVCPDMTGWNHKYLVVFWLTQSEILLQPLCLCIHDIIHGLYVLNVFIREHLILCCETLIGSSWGLQLYTFLFSREKARGTAENKHGISGCMDDILCTCLMKRLCFSPKPFLLLFSHSIAYKFRLTLSGYYWMKPEISGCVLAHSIRNIAAAYEFVYSWYYPRTLFF